MPEIDIKICGGINCSTRGGQQLLELIERTPRFAKKFTVKIIKCTQSCMDGELSPIVHIGKKRYINVTPEILSDLLDELLGK